MHRSLETILREELVNPTSSWGEIIRDYGVNSVVDTITRDGFDDRIPGRVNDISIEELVAGLPLVHLLRLGCGFINCSRESTASWEQKLIQACACAIQYHLRVLTPAQRTQAFYSLCAVTCRNVRLQVDVLQLIAPRVGVVLEDEPLAIYEVLERLRYHPRAMLETWRASLDCGAAS